ncbi:MAG: hypothetical protein GY696_38380 [Gammaproteobacteria bacterium]|nr:hypothetical protein [Gammaproteobacteria bacterium]
MDISQLHILVGWGSMVMGAISGAIIGLFFHRDEWAGGYGSFRRRMMRLGHIAFFGIGFMNLMFGLTLQVIALPETHLSIASYGFIVAVIAMPLCCFLSAWHKPFRHLFPIPVLGVLAGVVPIVLGGI